MSDEKKVVVDQVAAVIKINAYQVIRECVERGLAYGYQRAFKHVERSDEEKAAFDKHEKRVLEEQEQQIMNELCEYLNFGNDG